MEKRKIYFFESNIPMDNTVYLPLVSGILRGYAESFMVLKMAYEFMPFIFMRDTPENMIKDVKDPFLMCFSVCIWNDQLSLAVAKLIKERFPKCIILFGGPQVLKDYPKTYPFIDHIITGEGEKQYIPYLAELIGMEIALPEYNIDDYPSPYTLGLYDYLLKEYPHMTFQAIVETDRYCPFGCEFCFWGQPTLTKKIKFHSLEYVAAEADWIGRNGIKYVFMANANFGMYERDQEVAQIYVRVKEKYGYPDKVRVCYGKNKIENVFKTALIMHEAKLGKAVTLARQSNSPAALAAIKRENIKLEVFDGLAMRYLNEGIPTYTEIILGLPGETLESFKASIADIIKTPTQLFIYHCTILNNTGMADPAYIEKYGIKTVRVPLTEIHCSIRKPEYVQEYENIIIGTNTMSIDEWIDGAVFSWMTQLKFVFDLEDLTETEEWHSFIFFKRVALNITQGTSRAQVDKKFGDIYWEPEELAFLRIMDDRKLIQEDPKEFARKYVLWGRKSKVHRVKQEACS